MPDAPPRRQIYAALEQCRAVPDFNNYLAYLLSQAAVRPARPRQAAMRA